MFEDTASVLFGIDGLDVADAEAGPDGTVTVWAVTRDGQAARCPDCTTLSGRVHDRVLTRPRDVRQGGSPVRLWWVRRRWKCGQESCPRKMFTEAVPQVPPRHRVTSRLRGQAAAEVADRGITPAEAARHAGVSWPVADAAFASRADPVLTAPPRLVAHPGDRRAPPRSSPVADRRGQR